MSRDIIGKVLLDQYRVDAFIASGGMGTVYRVWDLQRNVPLAMKVLHDELAEDPHMFKRFRREANALKNLTHPNIVPFYGLFQSLDIAFLLERYVDGPTLKDILRWRTGKPLSIQETLVYLKALCSALGYAHANGVVHCDVKPGNIIVDQGGNIYLTDFGIARHAESATTTMASAGTAAYMAPEQIRGEPVTPATDVYALGVMLFEMLTGQRPFRGTEQGIGKGGDMVNERIRYAHLHLQPPDPRTLNPSLPPPWAQILLKALEKNPAKRYPFMQELLEAACIASGVTFAQVADRIHVPSETQGKISATQTTVNRPYGPPSLSVSSGRTILPWLAGGIVLALIMILAFSSTSGPNPPQPTATEEMIVIYDPPVDTPVFTGTTAPTRTRRPTATSTIPSSPTESSSRQFVKISNQVGEASLRRSPGYLSKDDNTDVIIRIPSGATIEIIGGPEEADDLTWWKVSWNRHEGWIAERTGSGRTIMIFDE